MSFDMPHEEPADREEYERWELSQLQSELAALRSQCEWREVTETEPVDTPTWLTDGKYIWIGERNSQKGHWLLLDSGLLRTSIGWDCLYDLDANETYHPTHWLPLPTLPEAKE